MTDERAAPIESSNSVLRFPYKPPRETVARAAEFLALASTLNAPDAAQLAQVTQQLAALRREIARLNGELAVLEAHDRELRETARAATPEFRRVNELALHLAMELPAAVWRAVQQSMRPPNQARQAWEEAAALLHEAYGAEGKLTGADLYWSWPGVNRPPGP
jgi:sugar phosphate isomerase/epimerase